MINIIVFSTFIGSMISRFLGRYIGMLWSRIIVCTSVICSLVATYILYYDVMILDYEYRNIIMSWISVDYLNIDWGFLIDKVSVSVLIPVVTISSLVHIYAVVYMSHDPHQQRFFSYLSFFTFGMIVLVTGDNLLILFLGWELIGVASYLLISFWFTRISAGKSGLNSLLLNRFGDTFFVIGLGLTVYLVGSLNFDTLFSLNGYLSTDMLTIILICMLIGCASKSVQFGLHTWLLNSMEGPTPVSSLLHAACLVIAGVYLLVRCSYIVEYSPIALILILVLGGITTLVSGLIAVVSNDIKKIIALSTMSQLARKYVSNKVPARTPCGAEINKNILKNLRNIWNQTICVEIIKYKYENSQITKTRYKNNNVKIFKSSSLLIRFFKLKLKEWKYVYISKLVGISEAIRLMFYNMYNILIINKEETYKEKNRYNRTLKAINELKESLYLENDKDYNEWLSGVIDGDGYLNVSKGGTVRLIITMEERDKMLLEDIKSKLGGSIYKVSNSKAYKYKLSNLKGLMNLLLRINGLIRNPTRMLQLSKVCKHYGLELKMPKELTKENGWFSGLIDSDGSIYINEKIKRVEITVSQKNIYILDILQKVYGGKIYPHSSKKEAFKYEIYRKLEVKNLVDNYFNKYPLRSAKKYRLKLIHEAYNKLSNLDLNNPLILKEWIEFKDKWDNYKK